MPLIDHECARFPDLPDSTRLLTGALKRVTNVLRQPGKTFRVSSGIGSGGQLHVIRIS